MVLDGGEGKGPEGSGGRDPEGGAHRERALTLIRFALRTGRVVVGETGARIAARRKKSGVLLVASDLDAAKAGEIRRWASAVPVPVFAPVDAATLGAVAGRDRVRVLFVYDRSLCRSLVNELGGRKGFC